MVFASKMVVHGLFKLGSTSTTLADHHYLSRYPIRDPPGFKSQNDNLEVQIMGIEGIAIPPGSRRLRAPQERSEDDQGFGQQQSTSMPDEVTQEAHKEHASRHAEPSIFGDDTYPLVI